MGSALIFLLALKATSVAPESAIVEIERAGLCGNWAVAIYASGTAHVQRTEACSEFISGSTLRKVSSKQIRKLLQTLKEAEFARLPTSIEPETIVVDEDVLTIRVRNGSGSAVVNAFGLDRVKDTDLSKRFLAVWEAVVNIVPEPKD
jgi:hypothetical protein